jgi:endonuclease YncB( thermonuclease family)
MGSTFVFPLLQAAAIDGDTLRVMVDQGMHNRWVGDMRVAGVDAPELHATGMLERQAAGAVRDFVSRWLAEPGEYRVFSAALDDKFGRLLGDAVRSTPGMSTGLGGTLLKIGCRAYNGEAKRPWTDVELQSILTAIGARAP